MKTPKQVAQCLKQDRRVSQGPNGLVFCDGFLSNMSKVHEAICQIEPNIEFLSPRVQELLTKQILRELNLSSQQQLSKDTVTVREPLTLVELDGRSVTDEYNRPLHDGQAQLWPTRSAA